MVYDNSVGPLALKIEATFQVVSIPFIHIVDDGVVVDISILG
jgi:hypothetical protein